MMYGALVSAEVLGGWCDLESIKDCIQSDDRQPQCESIAIRALTRTVQSVSLLQLFWRNVLLALLDIS